MESKAQQEYDEATRKYMIETKREAYDKLKPFVGKCFYVEKGKGGKYWQKDMFYLKSTRLEGDVLTVSGVYIGFIKSMIEVKMFAEDTTMTYALDYAVDYQHPIEITKEEFMKELPTWEKI